MCFFVLNSVFLAKLWNYLFFLTHISHLKPQSYIPLLIASTGSKLEAEIAGKIPEIKPISAAKPVPKQTLKKLKTNSNSRACVRTIDIIQTKNTPINPPIIHKIIASKRN